MKEGTRKAARVASDQPADRPGAGMKPVRMERDQLQQEIDRLGRASAPDIALVKPAKVNGPLLGVFSSSFNPITTAHVALMEQAAKRFSLDQILVLAGVSNADKEAYDCPLIARIEMLDLVLGSRDDVSIGISSTPFFVDMVDAIARVIPSAASPYFIVGFDTFVRMIDFEGNYLRRYYTRFRDRSQALAYLLSTSYLIVAARSGQGADEIAELAAREPLITSGRVLYLDFPADLGERSATEVRKRVRDGKELIGLVPPSVERFIRVNRLYSAG